MGFRPRLIRRAPADRRAALDAAAESCGEPGSRPSVYSIVQIDVRGEKSGTLKGLTAPFRLIEDSQLRAGRAIPAHSGESRARDGYRA